MASGEWSGVVWRGRDRSGAWRSVCVNVMASAGKTVGVFRRSGEEWVIRWTGSGGWNDGQNFKCKSGRLTKYMGDDGG